MNVQSSLITTCGADGNAIIWKIENENNDNYSNNVLSQSENNQKSSSISSTISSNSNGKNNNSGSSNSRNNIKIYKKAVLSHSQSQIYACESLDVNKSSSSSSSLLMTAADSVLYLWDVNNSFNYSPDKIFENNKNDSANRLNSKVEENTNNNNTINNNTLTTSISSTSTKNNNAPIHTWTIKTDTIFSQSTKNNSGSLSENFGGPRNPENQIFIFDAKINPCNSNIIAVALSDGTVRQIDIRLPTVSNILNNTSSSFSHSNNVVHKNMSDNSMPATMNNSNNDNNDNDSNSSNYNNSNSINDKNSNDNSNNNNDNYHNSNSNAKTLSSLSLSGLAYSPFSPIKKARTGNHHATSVS